MTEHERCTECGHTLLINNGALRCCRRNCSAYGQEQEPEPAEQPAPYVDQWMTVKAAIRSTTHP